MPIPGAWDEFADATMPAIHIALLVALLAIGPVAFQIFLPALPDISADFHPSSTLMALMVSLAPLSLALLSKSKLNCPMVRSFRSRQSSRYAASDR